MNSRNRLVIILAVVLMVAVMGVAAWITFSGLVVSQVHVSITETWKTDALTVSSLKMSNLTSQGKSDLFAQAGRQILVFNASGQKLVDRTFSGTLMAAMGEVDGNGMAEVLAYSANEEGSQVQAFRAFGDNQVLWRTSLEGLGTPSYMAVVDFNSTGRSGLVVGDTDGQLVAISEQGQELWRYALGTDWLLRGLDNILVPGGPLVVAADEVGNVVALDREGHEAWSFKHLVGLRRLRTEEIIDPGRSAVLLGGEDGSLVILNGATGAILWQAFLGQAITEIRLAELNGDPGTRELVVGGKLNGVWGYTQDGKQLFTTRIGGSKSKVMEIAGLDVDGDGRDLIAIGDDGGIVTFFSATGSQLTTLALQAPINRLTNATLNGQNLLLAADAGQIHGLQLTESLPFKYYPLIGGLLACLVIALAAFLILSLKPAPVLQISADQMTVEAQKARRLMLHEAINDLKSMDKAGQVAPDAYLERVKDLRGQLAEVTANLLKLGVPIKAETIACPQCGGTLELGADRCDYCGQTIIL